jgi:hypothetical protein
MKLSLSPRLALLIIAAMFLFPLLFAWMMYTGKVEFKPISTRNLGSLVVPPIPVDWTVTSLLPLETNRAGHSKQSIDELKEHWVLLQAVPEGCDETCLIKVSALRQIHLASGHKQTQFRLALLLDQSSPADQAKNLLTIYPKYRLITDSSGLLQETLAGIEQKFSTLNESAGGVFMIDPAGNIMMYYQADGDPNDIKQDLKRLLN